MESIDELQMKLKASSPFVPTQLNPEFIIWDGTVPGKDVWNAVNTNFTLESPMGMSYECR